MLFASAALIGALVFLSGALDKDQGALPKINVGIVGAQGDAMTERVVDAVENMEVVRSITQFHFVSEKEADKRVEDGTYDAAIYLTENMYEDINEGYNTPVRVRYSSSPTLSVALFEELVECGVYDLGVAESSIYAFYDMSETYETVRRPRRIANKLAARYIRTFLARNTIWENALLSGEGSLSTAAFAAISLILGASLLLGVGFAIYYTREEWVTGQALARIGVPHPVQAGIKIGAMACIIWLFIQIMTLLLHLIPILREIRLFHPLGTLVLAIGMAVYIHLIYSLSRGISAAFIYLITTVLMVIVGGGFFPLSSMPAGVAACARILPFAGWHRLMAGLAGSGADLGRSVLIVCAGIIVMLLLSLAVEHVQRKAVLS